MKSLSILAIVATLGVSLALHSPVADAKRLGGGKSVGMQRQASTPDRAPSGAPAQSPSAPAAANAPAAPSAAAQTAPKRSWMGPLAGLAAGLGLAALASHFGFGGELASMMMMGLVVMAVLFAVGFFMRRRAQAQTPALAGAGGVSYRTASAEQTTMPRDAELAPVRVDSGSGAGGLAGASAKIPADFDVAGFVRNAKVNFIRLQASNDAGNLDDIREFTTPEMFAEIKMEISDRQGATQETDVVNIGADLLEVAEEASRYVASVRFSGLLREEKNGQVAPIDEIWHLVKPRSGGGWLLAGIQQLQ